MKWLTFAFLVAFAGPAPAQSLLDSLVKDSIPFPRMRFGFVVGEARETLTRAWDDTNPRQVERGYCATRWHLTGDPDFPHVRFYTIAKISAPDTIWAEGTQNSIGFECPTGTPTIHVHPPITCTERPDGTPIPATCQLGGNAAYQCSASGDDMRYWLSRNIVAPFSVVQCDRNAFVFIWADRTPTGWTLRNR